MVPLFDMVVYPENTLMLKKPVILSGAFPREDLIFLYFNFGKDSKR